MIFAFAAMFLSVVNVDAKTIKNATEKSDVPAVVEIANTNTRSMVTTSDSGKSYKYEYVLDGEGRVINRITSVWCESKCLWKPLCAYSVSFSKDETILRYAKYSNSSKSFSKNVQQVRYNAADYPAIFKLPSCCE